MKKKRFAKEGGILKNFLFLIRQSWQLDKWLVLSTAVQIPLIVLLPLLESFLVADLVGLATKQVAIRVMLGHILGFSAALLVIHILKKYTDAGIQWRAFGNRFLYLNLCCEKVMNMDYQELEQPKNQVKMGKAMGNLAALNSGLQQAFAQLVSLGSNFLGIFVYSALLISFEPVVVLVLLALSVVIYVTKQKYANWQYENKEEWVSTNRKLDYIRQKSGDFQAAKDIRLYRMKNFFQNYMEKLLTERLGWKKKEERKGFLVDFLGTVLAVVRDGCAYGLLLYRVISGGISATEFVFYFQIMSQYATLVFGVLDSYYQLKSTSNNILEVREFLDIPNVFFHGKGEKVPETSPEITFRNVTFRYPESEEPVLKGLNFTIRAGEKIAVVGMNGAGKTTLIKLLCGLYEPTEGEILVGGQPIKKFNQEEYYRALSVVFQEVRVLPVSVVKNICLCEEKNVNEEKFWNVLELSGLAEKIKTFPQKEKTLLLKGVVEGGVELSGGELQKLAMARALYKNAPIMVLDEPTSALDPLAEKDIYEKYWKLTEKSTSVFVSHRLSSTQFCDRIFFMKNGNIQEEGSHKELMQLAGGYAEMFQIQSQYYREGAEE